MTPTELAGRLAQPNPPRLLDVRQADEFAIVALPGAKLLPLNELPERVAELAGWREQEVVGMFLGKIQHAVHPKWNFLAFPTTVADSLAMTLAGQSLSTPVRLAPPQPAKQRAAQRSCFEFGFR